MPSSVSRYPHPARLPTPSVLGRERYEYRLTSGCRQPVAFANLMQSVSYRGRTPPPQTAPAGHRRTAPDEYHGLPPWTGPTAPGPATRHGGGGKRGWRITTAPHLLSMSPTSLRT